MPQDGTPAAPYPTSDTPLPLPSGVIVRVRNLVIFRGTNIGGLTVIIETPTLPSDPERVAREASEVAELHSELVDSQGLQVLTVGICRTRACVEMREIPATQFRFVRTAARTWRAEDEPPP